MNLRTHAAVAMGPLEIGRTPRPAASDHTLCFAIVDAKDSERRRGPPQRSDPRMTKRLHRPVNLPGAERATNNQQTTRLVTGVVRPFIHPSLYILRTHTIWYLTNATDGTIVRKAASRFRFVRATTTIDLYWENPNNGPRKHYH